MSSDDDKPDPANAPVSAVIIDLSKIDRFKYEQRRKQEAEKHGVRVSVLDQLVELEREIGHVSNSWEVLKPWPEPVIGHCLLTELVSIIRRHIVLPKHEAVTVALWIMHTYAMHAARCTPVLAACSPVRRCGKTQLQTLLCGLVHNGMQTSNVTAAAIFRSIETLSPCLIIDEFDTFADGRSELRGILNSGHTRAGAFVMRCTPGGGVPQRFSTWAPKSIAMIGQLPPTLQDRSIILSMRRKTTRDKVARLPLDITKDSYFKKIRRRCIRWVRDHGDDLSLKAGRTMRDIPKMLNDRQIDNWAPLFDIADVAANHWGRWARDAAVALSEPDWDADDIAEQLLADLRTILYQPQQARISSVELVGKLGQLEDRPWPEYKHGGVITPTQLSRLLRPFGIHPRAMRSGSHIFKGYTVEQFADAFKRYLPPEK